MPPKKVPRVVIDALLEEIEESTDFEELAKHEGVEAERLRERVRRKLQERHSGSDSKQIDAQKENRHKADGGSEMPVTQQNGLAALAAFDRSSRREVESGLMYRAWVAGGYDLGKPGKYRASFVQAVFNGLERRGFILLERKTDPATGSMKKVATLTPTGRQYAEAKFSDLVKSYEKVVPAFRS